jgi:metal-dependent amidase/aminoacylase/carboxypeptidase family protein
MHGCGHDTHITVGLYLAASLVEHRDLWSGTVVMLFQPGEETGEGARAMLDDGLWDSIVRPEVIYGQHVWPGRAGHVYVSSGTAMAMSDCLKVTVKGRAGPRLPTGGGDRSDRPRRLYDHPTAVGRVPRDLRP